MTYIWFNLIILIIFCKSLQSINQNIWTHNIWLDPYEKYSLKWTVNADNQSIDFLCEVRTTGWIGLGLSPNGGMKSSDIIIAWIDDNTGITHFHDRFASGESVPQIDESQDWYLISSKQNSTHTVIHFQRPLITCDHNNDRDITRDTTRLIYAYSDSDPQSDTDLKIHSSHQRGSKNIMLLTNSNKPNNRPQETDLKSYIFNVNNLTVPISETSYWCKIFKLPAEHIHVVQYRSIITPGNEPLVHHMSLMACFHPNYQTFDQHLLSEGIDCTDMPVDYAHCFNPYLTAVGKDYYYAPKDIAFPFGDQLSTTYLMLNIHYDNPEGLTAIDSSGFELLYTKQYRKYEAFEISLGSVVDYRVFIPPHLPEFTVAAHCHTSMCFDEIPESGLKVFGALLHSHYLARRIRVRHFRGNQELPWITFDDNFDYNLQPFRLLHQMVIIKPGDQLTVECVFDSSYKNRTTFGGLATTDEMCLAFLYYYPRMNKQNFCLSGPTRQSIKSMANMSESTSDSQVMEYLLNKQNWDVMDVNKSQHLMTGGKHNVECHMIPTDTAKQIKEVIGYPNVEQIYRPIRSQCKASNELNNGLPVVYTIVLSIIVMLLIIGALFAFYAYRNRLNQRKMRLI
ncbi:DBH-like monooxygenase protein 1 [Oppia nitens]|uniref:DBH-like monooxygenase protein 1 n=1 Tax=Oppia nitens TaxID=1686743 RepID=UPI0023DBA565|nr:DBH-like monooxygenase protein 1 [Oppia nitens]